MKTVLDNFFDIFEYIKSQSGSQEAIRSPYHPLNSPMHLLKSSMHPLRSVFHPLNSSMNANRGVQRLRMVMDLLNDYVLPEQLKFAKKQSSDAVTKIASKALRGMPLTQQEIKMLAASVLSQDEVRGSRKAV